jgi:SOS-response transcriptional repressor LexA
MSKLYGLEVSGDELASDGIHDKDIVVIDNDYGKIEDDRILYVVEENNQLVARHLHQEGDDIITYLAGKYTRCPFLQFSRKIRGRIVTWGKWRGYKKVVL